VDYVAMDIKNDRERYAATAGFDSAAQAAGTSDLTAAAFDLAPIEESVRYLLSGPVDYEFRTTVVREFHDAQSFRGIGEWIRGAEKYFLQPFIDRDSVIFAGLSTPDKTELAEYLKIITPYVNRAEIRGASLT